MRWRNARAARCNACRPGGVQSQHQRTAPQGAVCLFSPCWHRVEARIASLQPSTNDFNVAMKRTVDAIQQLACPVAR